MTSLADHMPEMLDHIEAVNTGQLRPVPTGFADLDALTAGGLHPGTLTVIASRPGMGRTTLLTDICRHNALHKNTPVAIWTLEETVDELTQRILSAEARIPLDSMRGGRMNDDHWTRMARRMPEAAAAPLYIHAPALLKSATLDDRATDMVYERGVKLLAVDGIQDIRPAKRNDLREREVGDVVRDLKTLARELQVPVVATAHLNRNPERAYDRRPRLDDLRESGAITFAADLILLLHREDYYDRESPRAGEADIHVAKHRHGQTAIVTVAHQGHYGRFVDMAPFEATPPKAPAFDLGGLFTTPDPTPKTDESPEADA